MEIQPATVEQIASFKKAAAARYKARGIPAKVAAQLFDRHMAKMAGELGVPVVTPKVETLATKLAEVMGRKRKAA